MALASLGVEFADCFCWHFPPLWMKDYFQKLLESRNVQVEIGPHDLVRLRTAPPGVFVANHLYNGLDELILMRTLAEREPGPKFAGPMAISPYSNRLPKKIKPLLLRPKGGKIGAHFLQSGLSTFIAESFKKGAPLGLAIDFSGVPLAGWPLENIERALLRRQLFRMLRRANVPVIPVRLSVDSPIEVFLKSWLPVKLPKLGKPVQVHVRVGKPIFPDEIEVFEKNRQWRAFLRAKIFSLGSPIEVQPFFFFRKKPKLVEPLIKPIDTALLEAEIAALPGKNRLASRAEFDVFVAESSQIPNLLREIGRLRELTFRKVGEGTGRPLDLDEYDLYYQQLFLWNRAGRQIAGGYRIGEGDRIFEPRGPAGFYTASVFRFENGFFDILKSGAELGRSFVAPDYQRHRLPLFLLWKGILHFLEARPQLRFLFGPVSISKDFSEVSKSVMVEFIRKNCFDNRLAKAVEPRKTFRFRSQKVDSKLLAAQLPNIEALENFIADIEPTHIAAPVLLRQYLKQNARFVAFNVDPDFSDCLDGLMLLNLTDLPASTLENLHQDR